MFVFRAGSKSSERYEGLREASGATGSQTSTSTSATFYHLRHAQRLRPLEGTSLRSSRRTYPGIHGGAFEKHSLPRCPHGIQRSGESSHFYTAYRFFIRLLANFIFHLNLKYNVSVNAVK